MEYRLLAKTVLVPLYLGALLGSARSMAECTPVQGKIVNNTTSLGDVSTVGIVAFDAKTPYPYSKLKCGIVGIVNPNVLPDEPDPELAFLGPLPSFTHLISCDEHSQLVFDTHGKFTDFDYVCTASFVEHSVPILLSGTGAFDGANGDGDLIITGTHCCPINITRTEAVSAEAIFVVAADHLEAVHSGRDDRIN